MGFQPYQLRHSSVFDPDTGILVQNSRVEPDGPEKFGFMFNMENLKTQKTGRFSLGCTWNGRSVTGFMNRLSAKFICDFGEVLLPADRLGFLTYIASAVPGCSRDMSIDKFVIILKEEASFKDNTLSNNLRDGLGSVRMTSEGDLILFE